jgi:hypothetical protein
VIAVHLAVSKSHNSDFRKSRGGRKQRRDSGHKTHRCKNEMLRSHNCPPFYGYANAMFLIRHSRGGIAVAIGTILDSSHSANPAIAPSLLPLIAIFKQQMCNK